MIHNQVLMLNIPTCSANYSINLSNRTLRYLLTPRKEPTFEISPGEKVPFRETVRRSSLLDTETAEQF